MRDIFRQCAKYAVLFYSPVGRFQIAEGFCRRPPRYLPCDLLQEIKDRYGTKALFAADAILFGWCFAFTLLLDLLSARLFMVRGILGFFCCAAAFCLCGEDWDRFLMKLCYLVFSFVCGGSWFVAAGFMLAFEHLTMEPKRNGGETLMNRKEKELFENCGVFKALYRLAFPTVIGQIILVVYNMADIFFVGLAGNDAMMTAVTVCMPAFMFLSAISNLFGVGGASVISRALGKKDEDRVKASSAFAFWGCLITALMYSIFAFIGRDLFADLLGGTDPNVHQNAVEYLVVTVAIGGAATSVSGLFSHLIRSEGRSIHASAGIMLGGILNIALDPLFMFALLPPGKEALGAAIATALSNGITLLYFIAVQVMIRKKSLLCYRPFPRMWRNHVPAAVLEAGLPACIMTLFENISYAMLDKLMSLSGIAMQTGVGVAKKINMLAHCIVRGIAQGALPLIGYSYAAGNWDRMRKAVKTAHMAAVGMACVCMAVNLVFARQLTGIFIRHTSPSLFYGEAFLRILCVGGPFSASAYTYISFFQATGEGRKSFFLALLRKGLVDIPLMFLLNRIWPAYGIVIATPLADAFCCAAANEMFRKYLRGKAGGVRQIMEV